MMTELEKIELNNAIEYKLKEFDKRKCQNTTEYKFLIECQNKIKADKDISQAMIQKLGIIIYYL